MSLSDSKQLAIVETDFRGCSWDFNKFPVVALYLLKSVSANCFMLNFYTVCYAF